MSKINSFSVNFDEISEQIKSFPVRVFSVKHIKGIPLCENELLVHGNDALIYIKRGRVQFTIDGNNVLLTANNIIFISYDTEYEFSVKSSECESVVIFFTQNTEFLPYKKYSVLRPGPKNDILSLVNKILREHNSKEQYANLLMGFYISELFVCAERFMRYDSLTSVCMCSETENMRRAKMFLDENYNKDINLSDLAEYVYLSDSYISHCFKKEYGISPKRYITEKRLAYAKELLRETDMTSAEIAVEVGFLSPQRFNSIFKKFENMSPLEYRRKNVG